MKRLALWCGSVLMLAALAGCGNTVAGPCTTKSDCPSGLCLTTEDTPGGYCTQQCTLGDDRTCPSGNSCVQNAEGQLSLCFKECSKNADCREGYVCVSQYHGNPRGLCVGPSAR